MKWLFWSSTLLIVSAYVAYPVWLYLRALFGSVPIRKESIYPSVTILLAVHNEEKYLATKLQNLAEIDYPSDRLQIVAVSDGSTDDTEKILAAWQGSNRKALILSEHRGKAGALNSGVAAALGEIIVFTDARQRIESGALESLIENFGDRNVGSVSGELIIGQDRLTASAQGIGLYWRLEKKIRHWEGLIGSTVGATGALYAVRNNLVPPLPEETILDDVYIPLEVVRQGYRVVFEPRALAFDPFTPGPKQEFRRKVRTLVGNYQLLKIAPWIVKSSNPIRFQFIGHKLLRLLVPFALLGVLLSTLWLRGELYELVLALQLIFYALAVLGLFTTRFGVVSRLADVSLAFIVVNSAAALAFVYFVMGKKAVWAR